MYVSPHTSFTPVAALALDWMTPVMLPAFVRTVSCVVSSSVHNPTQRTTPVEGSIWHTPLLAKILALRTTPVVACALLLFTATACNTATPAKPVADTESLSAAGEAAVRDSVKAVLNQFTNRVSTKDLDGAGKLYSDDGSFSWIENGSLSYKSARDVRASLRSMRSISSIKLAYYETQIDVLSPKVATVRTEFSQTFTDKPGRGSTYGGFLTMTVVRERDGWRIRNGHTSSRKPRPGL